MKGSNNMSNNIEDKLENIATAVEDGFYRFDPEQNDLHSIWYELNKLNEHIQELIAVIKTKWVTGGSCPLTVFMVGMMLLLKFDLNMTVIATLPL